MADSAFQGATTQDAVRQLQLFESLSNAYTFVRAQENIRGLAATSIGDMLRSRVAEIRGPHPQGLPSRLEELEKIKADFDAAIAQIRELERQSGANDGVAEE